MRFRFWDVVGMRKHLRRLSWVQSLALGAAAVGVVLLYIGLRKWIAVPDNPLLDIGISIGVLAVLFAMLLIGWSLVNQVAQRVWRQRVLRVARVARPSDVDSIIHTASGLPLADAAFELWMQRRRLDRLEGKLPAPAARKANVADPAELAVTVRQAFMNVLREQETAPDGPTFERLKRAQPQASDAELKQAIQAAVKLERDCVRHFSYQSDDLYENVTRAVELAKPDNPAFQERTYKLARDKLALSMR